MKLQKIKSDIYPFIDKIVDALYTEEINKIIDSENVNLDKRTFIMFICMYFSTRLFADDKSITKESIKRFMTELIKNPTKRQQCIKLFNSFEFVLDEKRMLE